MKHTMARRSFSILRMLITFSVSLPLSQHAHAFWPSTARYSFRRMNLNDVTSKGIRRSRIYPHQSRSLASSATDSSEKKAKVPLYQTEGIFAVEKPIDWTSNNVVSYIRGILERDARQRGAKPVKVGSRKNKNRIVKVGHGGTLDPLATGVLVIGVGRGTKELQSYLSGSKRYEAGAELGYETTTLDMEGNVTKTAPFDHVTIEAVEEVLSQFRGKISQIPPIFSAIRKEGKRLYEGARQGLSADDVEIEPREVEVYEIELINKGKTEIPKFELDVECGGGTYIRALIRDVGYKVDSAATTTYLKRTQQGPFTLKDCLKKDDWTPENIYASIDRWNSKREEEGSR